MPCYAIQQHAAHCALRCAQLWLCLSVCVGFACVLAVAGCSVAPHVTATHSPSAPSPGGCANAYASAYAELSV